MGVAFTLFTAIALFFLLTLRNIAVPHWRAVREAYAELFGFIEERLSGTEDIRSNGARSYVMRRLFELMRPTYQKELKAGWAMNIMIISSELIIFCWQRCRICVGAYLYLARYISHWALHLSSDITAGCCTSPSVGSPASWRICSALLPVSRASRNSWQWKPESLMVPNLSRSWMKGPTGSLY